MTERIEAEIRRLLAVRRPGVSICPSEVARALGGPDEADWRPLMPAVRAAAQRLAVSDELQVTQAGRPVNAPAARGPIRLRAGQKGGGSSGGGCALGVRGPEGPGSTR